MRASDGSMAGQLSKHCSRAADEHRSGEIDWQDYAHGKNPMLALIISEANSSIDGRFSGFDIFVARMRFLRSHGFWQWKIKDLKTARRRPEEEK